MSVKWAPWQLNAETNDAIIDAAATLLHTLQDKKPTGTEKKFMIDRLNHAVQGFLDDQEQHDEFLRAKANGEDV